MVHVLFDGFRPDSTQNNHRFKAQTQNRECFTLSGTRYFIHNAKLDSNPIDNRGLWSHITRKRRVTDLPHWEDTKLQGELVPSMDVFLPGCVIR